MSDPVPEVRASDADRDRVARLLQEHFAQGRLDNDEFTERLEQAYRARTTADLAPLTRDLPERDLADMQAVRRTPGERPRTGLRDPALMIPWILWAGVNALCFTIWLILFLTSQSTYPWFLWVAGPWGVVMLFITLGVLVGQRSGPNPGPE